MSPNLRLFLSIAVGTFVLDVASKEWVLANIPAWGSIAVIEDTFYLTHVRNPGAAFSMFADAGETFRKFFFVGVGGVAIAMIIAFFRSLSPGDRLEAAGLGSILGGALGNLNDRVALYRDDPFLLGGVVDWLHVRLWTSGSWPDFNFADAFIVIGVAVLVFELFVSDGEEATVVEGSGRGSGTAVAKSANENAPRGIDDTVG